MTALDELRELMRNCRLEWGTDLPPGRDEQLLETLAVAVADRAVAIRKEADIFEGQGNGIVARLLRRHADEVQAILGAKLAPEVSSDGK